MQIVRVNSVRSTTGHELAKEVARAIENGASHQLVFDQCLLVWCQNSFDFFQLAILPRYDTQETLWHTYMVQHLWD